MIAFEDLSIDGQKTAHRRAVGEGQIAVGVRRRVSYDDDEVAIHLDGQTYVMSPQSAGDLAYLLVEAVEESMSKRRAKHAAAPKKKEPHENDG